MNSSQKDQVELINRQIKELVGLYRDAIKQLNIPESEFWIWYTLVATEGDYTQQDICSIWSLPKQTINTIITRMRLKKQAYLEVIPGTRNHKVIRLTEAGKKYGEKIVSPISQAEERSFEKISPDELALVTNAFGKYIDIVRNELRETANSQLPRRPRKFEILKQ